MRAVVTRRPRLVMLRALKLGDFLTGVPAYRALARAFPDHDRILAAPAEFPPLAQLCGDIDEVADARPFDPLDDALRDADGAGNRHGRGPQSHELLLHSHPKRVIAFANRDAGVDGPAWTAEEHEVSRWCRMLNGFGIAADPADLDLRVRPYDPAYAGAIVVHPGAASESRRWPLERWIDLILRLRGGRRRIVLTGSMREFRRCRFIAKAARVPMDNVLAGKTSLTDLASLIGSSRAVICGDTGIAHVATAVRTPSILLFGPTAPDKWGPPTDRPYHRVIWRGRTGDPHGTRVDDALAAITADEVLQELRYLDHMAEAG